MEEKEIMKIDLPKDYSIQVSPEYITTYDSSGCIVSVIEGSIASVAEQKTEPTLFDDLEYKMLGKHDNLKLEDSQIASIRSMLILIFNTFSAKSPFLNCFFTIGKGPNRQCFNYLQSLPLVKLSLVKDGSSTIIISSDWAGDRKLYEGWDEPPLNENFTSENKTKNYKARNIFAINNIEAINLYEWGFEILSKDDIQFVAILAYAIEDKVEQTIGHLGWNYPFKQKFINEPNFMKIIANWKIND